MVFLCLARLEDVTYQLYEVLFDKTEKAPVRLLLGKIMLETRNHREILEQLSKDYEHDSDSVVDCAEEMGGLYAAALEAALSMKEKVLAGMSVLDVMKALVQYEGDVGEEYVTQAHARIHALSETDLVLKKLLEDIAAEEKVHAEDLKLAIEIASKPPD
jgi:hypothetical protein